ncbi:Crp/Fnr family transcriptional regulator [Pseudobdellovibrio sp. HCB154]|uniref:Crp/Fnr family transcriptional regulator n=1 Tax=Pseudobdellovibrio sp. HCB154 TaxID=3386277 RepID=UPI00391737BC
MLRAVKKPSEDTNPCQSDAKNLCENCMYRLSNIICSTSPEVWRLVETTKQKTTFKPQQTIFYQGNEPLGLFTISTGLVKLEMTSEHGQTHTLRYLGPGSALGYRSLFSNEQYQATAVAVETSEICFIPKNVVMDIFKNYPEVTIKILEALSKDLRIAEEKWTSQMDKDASERIAEALIFLQEHFTHQNWTRKEIAEWAGTTPETVIRTLAQFEKEGYIDQSQGRVIKLINKQKLIEKLHGTY